MNTEGLAALKTVVNALEANAIQYMLGGSFASSFYGIPRATFDADLVVEISPTAAVRLYASLKDAFYADPEDISQAAKKHASFNLIHLETAFKVDIFPLKTDDYSKQAFTRRIKQTLFPGSGAGLWLQAPEDVVISKLLWHKLGGEASIKQPADIVGVLKTQAGALDIKYLKLWLKQLGLTDLFKKIESTT
ncbi:MAG: hypothetical protein A2X34_02055 [Elusimicrobia bacterium GWC2_51_8]|nr:MAG: hypothetical protein A2X33_01375 [Elusimicrobia bacterium GWA2_51_34]OGR59205.1 MAG: hypothetical protein A2X34_02055 [Elusimicrobia bacterium GWC2_51_8]OGR86401.1 MAG: hypothetical protein A2021_07300 [Elusimicrobia bacterium GWF2_52_66]HAF96178.1 hypothetical protein [Elusimicrobiota bacterium]HCE97789.1 hypothetical protein [Elusimicrobiota bacterium]